MIEIPNQSEGFQLATASKLLAESPVPTLLRRFAGGPFGLQSYAVRLLEEFAAGADIGHHAHETMKASILESMSADTSGPGLSLPSLSEDHKKLLGAFQIVVTVDAVADRLAPHVELPQVQGALELDGLDGLIKDEALAVMARLYKIHGAYFKQTAEKQPAAVGDDVAVQQTFAAALLLLKNAILRLGEGGSLKVLIDALAKQEVKIGDQRYLGFSRVAEPENKAGDLLDVSVDQIVGNEEYVQAAVRLAKDVAGFDLDTGTNPKKINPILFALGRPGCGKTVTAHAVGRFFLDYCKERDIPARFIVVRRSDWASSYQNASASNLIRLFEEKVKSFEGVCGIYWPDIDTALASRDSNQLRSEEKQNLGAVFGVFDGTILPKDGSWFMMCDANTMHMDEAAVSRIAQNPMTVAGATEPAHYARLMRDINLRDVRENLPTSDEDWQKVGEKAKAHDLSGRNIDAVCGNIRAHIQDFEYPPEYFQATAEERRAIIARLSRKIEVDFILKELDEFAAFHLEASKLDEEKRFQAEVDAMVRQLNAGKAAAKSLAGAMDTRGTPDQQPDETGGE